ncbi:hypothetical protein DEU56DRAFT_920272 [Suillus clintonianus]|uniref:uncharacterized protein n=1 Tax=Suillus clintonianus TaxID=1904413 RepID=UPI001B8615DB|nr:uncharacterized protein DEU56DRAFT_920272 [Suillus clintonianus]KAG2109810.1 hypothetical protein DEU56DRAFT_920272 [Suillus clintonianus]
MSDNSSSGSSHSLRSQGTVDITSVVATGSASRKPPAVWSKLEETTFLEYLLKALPSSGDGGFKMATYNLASAHLKEQHKNQKGAEKTGSVCRTKYTALKKAYYGVIDVKITSGFTWSDEQGAGITSKKDDVWARFVKTHPNSRPYMNKGFDHFEIMEQLLQGVSKGLHIFRPATQAASNAPQNSAASTSSSIPPVTGHAPPPSSVDPESLGPPVPSTFLSPSTEGSTTGTDSAWTSISRGKRKFSALTPSSVAGSQKRTRPPSATLLVQREGTETMKNLVEVVREMQKNLVLAPPPPPLPPVQLQPSTHVGSAISLLNKYTDLTSKERLAIANFLAGNENQAITFYSLDEATRLEWLEEKRVLCGGVPRQASADLQDCMLVG